jgi:hypothetical protein
MGEANPFQKEAQFCTGPMVWLFFIRQTRRRWKLFEAPNLFFGSNRESFHIAASKECEEQVPHDVHFHLRLRQG